MSDVRDRAKQLPRALRPDVMIKTPIACRFGWHQMHWGARSIGGMFQEGRCLRCGRIKDRIV